MVDADDDDMLTGRETFEIDRKRLLLTVNDTIIRVQRQPFAASTEYSARRDEDAASVAQIAI